MGWDGMGWHCIALHCIGVGWRETYGASLRSGLRRLAREVGGVGGVDLVFEGEHFWVAVLVMVVMVRGARGELGGGEGEGAA